MNEVFIIAKVKDINFEFMYDSKYISICIVKLQLQNKTKIKAYGYNEIADTMIQELKKEDIIFINGKLRKTDIVEISKMEIM